ncbi:penicillin-binding transpeptidase domain-containing protein [Alkalimarinus sediminis]|uniref:Beta-lactamase n=1 Tax=Alkalimarinus sediminis TaxID=1632866 RepID=A0A9E8HFN9_9ALTE|nr:penicillin-binding transpeptidase domain-containing protein [Alkalimarinus sediminis]UZW73783.1 penicillin-binding transpeptidase domain-containing protein [Alkalimarinus sediminis]
MNVLALFILSLVSITLYAEENKIEALYKLKNINGSILIESDDGKVKHNYNVNDNERFIPASTFKIPNTLIILEEGLIQDQSETIQWDGQEREYAPWNKDQTLKSAFQYSCVWCYQHFAKQVGDQKYRQYLQIFDYGNHLTGSDVTRFWLDGELRTSVNDQISFLRKVYAERLPVKKAHIKTLKSIMLSEEHNSYKVWSKTGWSGKDGWFVGYLVINKQVWYFANHIEINQNSDLKFRKSLTMEALKVLDIIPPKH